MTTTICDRCEHSKEVHRSDGCYACGCTSSAAAVDLRAYQREVLDAITRANRRASTTTPTPHPWLV